MIRIVVLGGGAAGFFGAIKAKAENPDASVILLEKAAVLLSKVRISGGGRCNVTHACFDPKQLIQNYPRGSRELLGPFNHFQPQDTVEWFESRGVRLKVEDDGRMFPVTDSSETIIQCLMAEAKRVGVDIRTQQKVEEVKKEDCFHLKVAGQQLLADCILLATGSSTQGHHIAESLGHTVQPPVPSLFTFNIPEFSLKEIAGIAVEKATVKLPQAKLQQTGPLLITHWGFSGPGALKLSAWGARALHACHYETSLEIDWVPDLDTEDLIEQLKAFRQEQLNAQLSTRCPFGLPKNLWKLLLEQNGYGTPKRLAEYKNQDLQNIERILKRSAFPVKGKTTHKEEFVTCGGITLKEVDFKTMQSRICPGLFFAGEVLDIDAVTGGFNFQNAWTTGWLAGIAMSSL